MTRPFLSAMGVACETSLNLGLPHIQFMQKLEVEKSGDEANQLSPIANGLVSNLRTIGSGDTRSPWAFVYKIINHLLGGSKRINAQSNGEP